MKKNNNNNNNKGLYICAAAEICGKTCTSLPHVIMHKHTSHCDASCRGPRGKKFLKPMYCVTLFEYEIWKQDHTNEKHYEDNNDM